MRRNSGGKISKDNRESRRVALSSSPYEGGRVVDKGNNRVYVGNLSWDVSWQDLKDFMRKAGEVARADVLTENADGRLRSKGCGLVEYVFSKDAQNAIDTLNDTELKGRLIFVREDRDSQKSSSVSSKSSASAVKRRVYVGNLTWDVAWQDLKDHMRSTGDVVRADIMTSSDGKSLGCGLVEYATEAGAKDAIATLNDTELKGRLIFVREDREPAGTSFSSSSSHQINHRSNDSAAASSYKPPPRRGPPLGSSLGKNSSRIVNNSNSHNNNHKKTVHHVTASAADIGNKVFVGNLSWDVKWQDLKDHMRSAGNVLHADVLMEGHGHGHGHSGGSSAAGNGSGEGGTGGGGGRSKGCGIVEFDSSQSALKAINTLNNTMLNGRQIFIREDREENKSSRR